MNHILNHTSNVKSNLEPNQICGKYVVYPRNLNRIAEGGSRLKNKFKVCTEKKPLVSIITVCLNSDETIEETIESVINQTYNNIEYIIIDGASKDNTLGIIEKHSKYIDYYISEPDNGLYNAINKGISLASGKYILILNSDDWYTNDCVETLLDEINKNNADIVSSLAYIVNQNKEIKRITEQIPFNESLRLRMTLRHETMLIPSRIYNALGCYNETYKIISDFEFVIRLYDANYRIYELPKPLHFHRDTGISHNSKNELQKERLCLLKCQFPCIDDEDLNILADRKKLFLNAKPNKLDYYKYLLRKYKKEKKFIKTIILFLDFISTSYPRHINQYKELCLHDKTESELKTVKKHMEILNNKKLSIFWNSDEIEVLESIDDYEISKCRDINLKENIINNSTKLKVLTLCSIASDGAGTGTLRRVNALRSIGVEAKLISIVSNHKENYLGRLIPVLNKIDNNRQDKVWDFVREKSVLRAKNEPGYCAKELFSLTDSIIDFRQLNQFFNKHDIIHLHWCVGMIDYINGIDVLSNKPVVWTLADMNPFTGGCHYSFGCEKYKDKCNNCPQLGGNSNLALQQWKIKKYFFDNVDIHFISPSNWLASKAQQSSLLRNKQIHIIKNAFPINKLRPLDKKKAREILGLPINKKLILFGATNITNYRKGFDLFQSAIKKFRNKYDSKNVELVTFGRGNIDIDLKLHNLGHVKTEEELSIVYSAADLYLFTSREDNAPLTVGESLLCGTPVVGFSVGYLPEIIQHKETGYLSNDFDTRCLAHGINWTLKHICVDNNIAIKCRQSALEYHNPKSAAFRHKRLYEKLLTEKQMNRHNKPFELSNNNTNFTNKTFHILIPCLNMAEQVNKTIESIIFQTLNPNINIYIYDKGSTDNTIENANKWDYLLSCDKKAKPYRNCNVIFDQFSNINILASILHISYVNNINANSYIGWISPGDLLKINAFESIQKYILSDNAFSMIDMLNLKPINTYNGSNFDTYTIHKDNNFDNYAYNITHLLLQSGVFASKRLIFKQSYYIKKYNNSIFYKARTESNSTQNIPYESLIKKLMKNEKHSTSKDYYLSHEKNFNIKSYPSLSSFKSSSSNSKKLRICIATMEIFGPQLTGGIATTYYYLAKSLASADHEVDILLLNGPQCQNKTIDYWIDYYKDIGINLIPLNITNINMSVYSKRWHRLYYSFYKWFIDHKPYDIIHTSEFRGCACYALAAKKAGIAFSNTLFVVKTSSPYIWNRFYQKLPIESIDMFALMGAEQATVELADIVIGGSAHLLSFMEYIGYKMPKDRLFVQPNIIDMSSVQVDDKRSIDSDVIYSNEIVYFGRLEQRKGLEIFCEALDILVFNNTLPQKVVFLGKHGVKLPHLVDFPKQNNITYINERSTKWPFKVEIIDNYNQHQANQFLVDKPRIAVMPSIIENSSMTVYEALYHKVPFVATATGGTPELIHPEDRHHCLCKPDPNSLAEKIANLLSNGCKIAKCSFNNEKNVLEWKTFHDYIGQHIEKYGNPNILSPEFNSKNLISSNIQNNHTTQKFGLIIAHFGNNDNLKSLFSCLSCMKGPGFEYILVMINKLLDEKEETYDLLNKYSNLNINIKFATSQSLGEIYNTGAKLLLDNNIDICSFVRSDIHFLKNNFTKYIRKAFNNNDISLCSSFFDSKKSNQLKTTMPLVNDMCLALIDKHAICGDVVTLKINEMLQLDGFSSDFGLDCIVQELYAKFLINTKNTIIIPLPIYEESPEKSLISLQESSGKINILSTLLDKSNYYTKRLILLSLNAKS